MPSERSILHVDMDAFFAAVEQLDNPQLRGKPVLVGSDSLRGVVATASYEARIYGCHSAQPMSVARRNCPHAVIVPCRFARYREISDRLFEIFDSISPLVQPLSIDEAFLDITGTERAHAGSPSPASRGEGWGEAQGMIENQQRPIVDDAIFRGSAVEIARRLKSRIHDELHLTASIGVANNKFLAKLASDLEKPDGLTVIAPDDVDRILPPLPVTRIWGIGPKTAKKLDGMAIRTIGDLRRASDATLKRLLGEDADRCRNLAFGRDDRLVVTDSEAKQISQEQTFRIDITDPQIIRAELLEQVQQVARRLRKHHLTASGVTLKIRFGQFQTITRSRALDEPTDRTDLLWQVTQEIFNQWANQSFQPVRLIGMAARSLRSEAGQLPLFVDPIDEKHRRLDQALDVINSRFGEARIRRGARPDE